MQTGKYKFLYKAYKAFSDFYFKNRLLKTSFNWLVGSVCASPPGFRAFQYLHSTFVDFPLRVQIETTSCCNAKCVMCAHPVMPRRNQHMEQSLYEKIIAELALHRDQLKVLSLHFMGEPLMDPLIFDRIKLAKQSGIREVHINTNCQLLTPEKARRLIESGLDTITFSLGGLDEESQDKRRIGTTSLTVQQNIDSFIDLVDAVGPDRKKPGKFIYTVKSSSKDRAYEAIIKKYKHRVDSITVVSQNNWGGNDINEEKNEYLTKYRIPCPLLFSTMVINVNGKANICCIDYADREIMGDTLTSSLYEIWHSEKMEHYRHLHLKQQENRISMCRDCTLYR